MIVREKNKDALDVTELVTDIVIRFSPAEMVDPEKLKKWYKINGTKYLMDASGTNQIHYNVDFFNFMKISEMKKHLWFEQQELEIKQQFYNQNNY